MLSETLIHCDESAITLDCPTGNMHLSLAAVQSDPLVLVDALAPLSPASLDNAGRVQWTLNALKRIAPAVMPRLSELQTPSDARLVSWRVAVQQESMEDEFFVPFDGRGEFVMFNVDQDDTCEDDHCDVSLLVPRKQFYLQIVAEDDKRVVHAYAYEPVCLQLNSVYDVVGFLDSDAELHLLCATQPAAPEAPRDGMFDELVALFVSLFSGDKAAAQMLVLGLVSTTTARQEGLLSSLLIGNLPLNLILPSPSDAAALIDAVKAVKRCQVIDCSTWLAPDASKRILYPRFDSNTSRLEPSPVQLPRGDMLVVDESRLLPGKLDQDAIRSVRAIQHLVTHQKLHIRVACDDDETAEHDGSSIDVDVDNPVLVISSGSKSIFDVSTCTFIYADAHPYTHRSTAQPADS